MGFPRICRTVCLWLLAAAAPPVSAWAQNRPAAGIFDQPAPAWEVTEWAQLPEGSNGLDVDDFRGKVLYVLCFQSQCTGCQQRGFPILKQLSQYYQTDSDVAFVAIQTVFEGFSANTLANAQQQMEKFGLDIPVGQSGDRNQGSRVMAQYRTGATPWTIIIDKNGTVIYNYLPVSAKLAVKVIDRLKKQGRKSPPDAATGPTRGGKNP